MAQEKGGAAPLGGTAPQATVASHSRPKVGTAATCEEG